MPKDALIAAIERHETLADSFGSLSDDRSEALDRYLGHPMGNEIDGRSQVVSRDVWDTVEWLKPQLAEVFCGGDQVVSFSPRGPEDVKAAEQESEYVNHVITEKNNWFEVYSGWQHDALLQKNGYVTAYWDDREDRSVEEYKGLSADELALLAQDPEVQIESGEQTAEGYSVKVARVQGYGCAKIINIPPERVLVSHNSRGLCLQDPDLDFVEYIEYKTLSQLRDDGFKVDDNLSDHSDAATEWEEDSRDDNNPFRNRDGDESSPAARRLKVRNVWIRFDADDDGRTELHRIVIVGKTILQDDEADEVTLYALCPIPLPHQHTGLSVADSVMDLEKIATSLLRGALDNVYLANNGRYFVDANRVNLDDMLVSRPGGIVRVQGSIADAAAPFAHAANGQVAVPMMEYVDRLRQKRTGVSESTQGLNANSLNNSMGAAANMAMVTAAQQRIKHIARIFAETGVKALFRGVHMLTMKHARKQELVRLRNQWVPIDPRGWRKRQDMSISVGLGSGDRPAQIAMLTQILTLQAQALPFGLASPVNVFNALKRLTSAAGYKDPLEFWTDPATVPPKPPQPPIELQKAQMEGQIRGQIEMGKAQAEMQIKREEFALKMREIEANLALQQSNDMRDSQREQLKAQFEAQLEAQRLDLERWKAELEAQIELRTTAEDNATKLQIAGMSAEQSKEGEMLRIGHEAMQKDADRQHVLAQKEAKERPARELREAQKRTADSGAQVAEVASAALKQMAEAHEQMTSMAQAIQKALKAKRVLVRGPDGRPTHSEIAEE
jgi:hypothetical protein